MKYKAGQLVLNNKLGLGKVLRVFGDTVTVYFKDQKDNPRTIHTGIVPMELAPEQSDPWFDQLGAFTKSKKGWTSERRAPRQKTAKAKLAKPKLAKKV